MRADATRSASDATRSSAGGARASNRPPGEGEARPPGPRVRPSLRGLSEPGIPFQRTQRRSGAAGPVGGVPAQPRGGGSKRRRLPLGCGGTTPSARTPGRRRGARPRRGGTVHSACGHQRVKRTLLINFIKNMPGVKLPATCGGTRHCRPTIARTAPGTGPAGPAELDCASPAGVAQLVRAAES